MVCILRHAFEPSLTPFCQVCPEERPGLRLRVLDELIEHAAGHGKEVAPKGAAEMMEGFEPKE